MISDDTIEDEIQLEEFAMAAAREASAMLLELLVCPRAPVCPVAPIGRLMLTR